MLKLACIPTYNEEARIFDVIKRTSMQVDQIVVCDDGSTDNTSKIAKNAGVEVVRHEKNLGKGAAMKSLFNYAKKIEADVVITIDGDGQSIPEEIPKLMNPILEKKSDIVIGNRFENNQQMPSYRKIGNKVLDKIVTLASDLPFQDTQSGFRAYSKKAIELIDFKTTGFGVDAEILVNASRIGLKIMEEKVTVLYDKAGKTSTKNPIPHSYEVISSIIEIIAIRHPLRNIGIPGLIFMTAGIILALNVLSIFNDTRYFSIPMTLGSFGTIIIGLILLLVAVVLFSINKSLKQR